MVFYGTRSEDLWVEQTFFELYCIRAQNKEAYQVDSTCKCSLAHMLLASFESHVIPIRVQWMLVCVLSK